MFSYQLKFSFGTNLGWHGKRGKAGQSFLIIAFSFFGRKCFEIEMGNLIGSLRMNKTTKEKLSDGNIVKTSKQDFKYPFY